MVNSSDSSYAERLMETALQSLSAGVDVEKTSGTVSDCLDALAAQAKALKAAAYSANKRVKCPECSHRFEVQGLGAPELAKAMAHTAKVVDETARLVQFTSGRPDSRPGMAGMVGVDWLQCLTDEQFHKVEAWVEENTREEENERTSRVSEKE